MIKENTKAPLFKIPSTNKNEYSLKDSLGKYVVIYFYPKDDTPGCTIETNDFNKLLPKFKKLNCDVFGISKDNLKVMINLEISTKSNLIFYLMKI
jgi:peroxiredoxin Q/BCP